MDSQTATFDSFLHLLSAFDIQKQIMSDTRYHLLPEEGRPSTDSVREDERLLGVFGISAPCVPKKSITFTYHPTLLLRLIAVALFIVSFAFHILSGSAPSCAAVAFLSFAITRNIMVLLTHIVRIKVEFGGVREETPGRIKHGKSKIGRFSTKRWPQLIIDFVLLVLLVIMTLIVQFSGMRWSQRYNAIVACIISWVAM